MWQNIFGFSDNCIDNCIWAGGCGFSLLLWGGVLVVGGQCVGVGNFGGEGVIVVRMLGVGLTNFCSIF